MFYPNENPIFSLSVNLHYPKLTTMKKIIITLVGLTVLSPAVDMSAQAPVIVNDSQKQKQMNSMENGSWDFAPDWYYYSLHKQYSGAEMYWTWTLGFIPTPHIRFKEDKSSQKRVFVPRAAQIPAVLDIKARTQTELDSLTPIWKEEMERTVDRNVDLMYAQYADDFSKMQASITECLSYSLQKSKGNLAEVVAILQEENRAVMADIDYIHKTGIGYEMENTKRQIAYEEARERMRKVLKHSADLVYYTKCHY